MYSRYTTEDPTELRINAVITKLTDLSIQQTKLTQELQDLRRTAVENRFRRADAADRRNLASYRKTTQKAAAIAERKKIPAVPAEPKLFPKTLSSKRNPGIALQAARTPAAQKPKKHAVGASNPPLQRGDTVRIKNSCYGVNGVIGLVAKVTEKQVHIHTSNTGEPVRRNFSNVELIRKASDDEFDHEDLSNNEDSNDDDSESLQEHEY